MGSTAVLSLLLLYLVFDVLHIATLKYAWLFWLEWAVLTLFYAPVVCALRKSSSLVHIGLLMAGGVPLDLFLEARYRSQGIETLWMYNPDGLLGAVHPLLRIAIVWFGDALICGPIALWIARVVAGAAFHKHPEAVPDLFPDEWSLEQVEKPHHDAAYYILRLIGLAYLSYFVLAILGLPGTAPWPKAVTRSAGHDLCQSGTDDQHIYQADDHLRAGDPWRAQRQTALALFADFAGWAIWCPPRRRCSSITALRACQATTFCSRRRLSTV